MKPLEILAALPQWANLPAGDLVASPAWAMPCRLGERNCTMRLDAPIPADTLDISIRLGDDAHLLRLADSAAFPELHAIWSSRAEVPGAILLALVEKDCGPFLQLLENASHRQLKVIGLAYEPGDAPALSARISADGEDLFTFMLTSSPALVSTLGQLRHMDLSHPAIREKKLPVETEYASFPLPAADIAALAPGDALVLPEVGTIQPRLVVDARFLIAESGVAAWKDDGLLRVVAGAASEISIGQLMDCAADGPRPESPEPVANAPLRLLRLGKVIATGRLDTLGGQHALIIDVV